MIIDWIGVDWGTSNLRAWPMSGDTAGEMRASDRGMGTLTREGFEPALLDLVGDWLGDAPMTVIACGMVGSRQGWVEAPYATVPCTPLAESFARPETKDRRLDVRVIPGLRQMQPADVMRGEETQIAGFLSLNPRFDGVLCLPGTHTKWVQVSAGEVVSFQTFMTGEMFAALSGHTVLRHSVGADGWDDAAFASALSDTLSAPETLARRLFSIRADGLLGTPDPDAARARLSGYLVGAELAGSRPYWLGQEIAIIGAPALTGIYAAALSVQGVAATVAQGDAMTLKGLAAAHAASKEHVT